MLLHNIYLLLFISSLLLPPHLAQPEASPCSSPAPTSSAPAPSSPNLIDDGGDIKDFVISLFPSLSNFQSTVAAAPSDIHLSPTNAPSPDAAIDPNIKKICDSTDYPSLCLATVSPFLDGKTDVPSVLGVSIKAGTEVSKIGQSIAEKLAADRSQMSSSLNECKDDFDNAVDNFGKAMDSLPEQDKGTINSMLSAVITYIDDCQVKISEGSELYSISDKLINMTSNCLAIASLMN